MVSGGPTTATPMVSSVNNADGIVWKCCPGNCKTAEAGMVLMPIYLVRWEGLKASLINAESEAALLDAIDEVNNPSRCTWTVYDGPIWIDFDIPIKYEIERNVSGRLRKEEVIVTDTAFPEDILVPSLQPGSDTCDYMRQTILQKAFPHLAEAFDYADHPAGGPHAPDIADSDVDWIPEPSKVRKAVGKRSGTQSSEGDRQRGSSMI
jgi:hypothetical protein